eukprot:1181031-Prorocentrum_minimum.AAC.5
MSECTTQVDINDDQTKRNGSKGKWKLIARAGKASNGHSYNPRTYSDLRTRESSPLRAKYPTEPCPYM